MRRPIGVGKTPVIVLLLALHLLVGIGVVAFGDRLGRRGFLLAALPPVAVLLWLATRLPGVLDGDEATQSFSWVPELGLAFDFRLDAFGAVMVLLVSGVGVLVCAYAFSYFSHRKPGIGRLAGLVTLFAGSMLGVVLTDQLMSLFVFWELTSITSYLLIGNDDRSPRARDAALSAILITGIGGLTMLAGFVLIGQAAGTYRISELALDPPSGTTVTVGVMLALVGAFTKSAQFPFSSWLPGAMVAPTPISTYLHAATMVKAGVYLIARLAPIFALVGPWRWTIVVGGAVTMLNGGWRAMRQHDLKLLLAYGTVSQLGFLVMLFGFGAYDLAQAGVVLLLAHAAFKAALFMVVGIVDHQSGTRDVRRLGGFGRSWRPVIVVGILAAASMAGIPPLLGFIAKEKALDAALGADGVAGTLMLIGIIVGSILTVAYSGRYVLGLLGHLVRDGTEPEAARSAPAPSLAFVAPAAVLAALSLLLGVAPVIIDRLVVTATEVLYPASHPHAVVLWAGFNTALLLSVVIIASGLGLVAMSAGVGAVQRRISTIVAGPSQDRAFWAALRGMLRVAGRLTSIVQNGSLPIYLMVVLGVAALAPLAPALASIDSWPSWSDTPIHVPIAAVIVVGAIGATILRRRIAAALLLSAVGYGMAAFYVVQGAPDLALTQFAIETLATVLFVLVLRFLPRRFTDRQAPVIALPIRLIAATAVGVSAFVFTIAATGAREDVPDPPISAEMLERSVSDGEGYNVVNVILVDFRGFDTLGEITVICVVALTVYALLRRFRPAPESRQQPRAQREDSARDALEANEGLPRGYMRIPATIGRMLLPMSGLVSLYFLLRGHNAPGGGFVGGLVMATAIIVQYMTSGVLWVESRLRIHPQLWMGAGLLAAGSAGILSWFGARPFLTSMVWEPHVPLIGELHLSSVLLFDLGVFMVVVGGTILMLVAIAHQSLRRPRKALPVEDIEPATPIATVAEV